MNWQEAETLANKFIQTAQQLAQCGQTAQTDAEALFEEICQFLEEAANWRNRISFAPIIEIQDTRPRLLWEAMAECQQVLSICIPEARLMVDVGRLLPRVLYGDDNGKVSIPVYLLDMLRTGQTDAEVPAGEVALTTFPRHELRDQLPILETLQRLVKGLKDSPWMNGVSEMRYHIEGDALPSWIGRAKLSLDEKRHQEEAADWHEFLSIGGPCC